MKKNLKKIRALLDLYNFIKIEKHVMEELWSDNNNIECCENKVYEDQDWQIFLDKLKVNELKRAGGKIILTDNITTLSIDYIDVVNRHDDDLPDETIFFIDTMRLNNLLV